MNTPNVDYAEVAKFTALADEWWDLNGAFKPLHDINPLRLDWIETMCFEQYGTPLKDKKVADIGCGGGILAVSMAKRGANVLGVDMGTENIAAARLHNDKIGLANLAFDCVPVETLAKTHTGQFDVVTCMEMLEHVPDPQAIIKACFELLKPNGLLVLSTINRNPKSYLFAIIGAEYVLKLLEKGTHDFNKFITPAELDKFASNAGFVRREMMGLHYNPITKRYWLAPDVSVNYMMAVVRKD